MITNLRVARVIRVQSRFSLKQWSLYEQQASVSVPPERVAGILNSTLEQCVNDEKLDKTETRLKMHDLMYRHSKWGASDSEPRQFLDLVLDEIYGPEASGK